MKMKATIEFEVDDEYFSYPESKKEETEAECGMETILHTILQKHGDGNGIVTDTLNVSVEVLHPAETPINPYY